jgi:hypothetical protein
MRPWESTEEPARTVSAGGRSSVSSRRDVPPSQSRSPAPRAVCTFSGATPGSNCSPRGTLSPVGTRKLVVPAAAGVGLYEPITISAVVRFGYSAAACGRVAQPHRDRDLAVARDESEQNAGGGRGKRRLAYQQPPVSHPADYPRRTATVTRPHPRGVAAPMPWRSFERWGPEHVQVEEDLPIGFEKYSSLSQRGLATLIDRNDRRECPSERAWASWTTTLSSLMARGGAVRNRSEIITVSTPRDPVEVVRQEMQGLKQRRSWTWFWLARRQGKTDWSEASTAVEPSAGPRWSGPGGSPRG